MELSFVTEALRAICESRRRATNKLGYEAAQALETMLADIDACHSMSEFTALYGDRTPAALFDVFEVTLDHGPTVSIISGHVTTPRRKDGRVDWNKVTRIRITEIGTLS